MTIIILVAIKSEIPSLKGIFNYFNNKLSSHNESLQRTLHSFSFIPFVPFTNVTTFKYITKIERGNSKLNYPSEKVYMCSDQISFTKKENSQKNKWGGEISEDYELISLTSL